MSNRLKICLFTGLIFATMPAIVFAKTVRNLRDLIGEIRSILNLTIPVIIGLAVVLFLWGVLKYIQAGDDAIKVKDGKNMIIFGIIGLFVMVSVWGLVNVLVRTFFESSPQPVQFESENSESVLD